MEFRGELFFLSNFFPSAILVEGIGTKRQQWVPTSEHLFQALKTKDPEEQQLVIDQESAGKAKRMGRKVTMREDWDDVKLDVMERVVRAKFQQNPELARKLVSTGSLVLVEENHWHDTFWGVDAETRIGENHLGKILMKIRQELKETMSPVFV